MRFKRVNSNKTVEVNLSKYLVNWNGDCRSKFQKEVKQWFKTYWYNDVCVEEFRVPGSRLRIDLMNVSKKIIVESNGDQHNDFNQFFHGNRYGYLKSLKRDKTKRHWAESNGFIFLEIEQKDLPLSLEFFNNQFEVEII